MRIKRIRLDMWTVLAALNNADRRFRIRGLPANFRVLATLPVAPPGPDGQVDLLIWSDEFEIVPEGEPYPVIPAYVEEYDDRKGR